MTYNEYWQLIEAGMKADQLLVFEYEDQGVATLEDGLYTTEAKLADPAMVAKLARFLKASLKGWQYARDNPDEAVKIVMTNDTAGAQTVAHQRRMMGEVSKLLAPPGPKMGTLDPAAYERTVRELMSGGSDPVISKAPEGAWTHAVSDAARPSSIRDALAYQARRRAGTVRCHPWRRWRVEAGRAG
jgi:NitT/TauT family transport system substrate-binding protein